MLTFLDFFNIAMTCGVVFMVLAIRQIAKDNKVLHAKNTRHSARFDKLYNVGTTPSD